MLRPGTGAMACLAVTTVMAVAVREPPSGIAPGASARPARTPGGLIVTLNGNDEPRARWPGGGPRAQQSMAEASRCVIVNAHIP